MIELATVLLVVVGAAQVIVLVMQRRQSRLNFVEFYRKRWIELREAWSITLFFGRDPDEYYQVVDKSVVRKYQEDSAKATLNAPTVWARESIQVTCSTFSDVCLRILQGQLAVEDVYPVFGTELLRQSRPLRILLDTAVDDGRHKWFGMHAGPTQVQENHYRVRKELQGWLIYHDGIRRRCLILIDLLWAEAVRLGDLPPDDIKSAADAKELSGHLNRCRLSDECRRLNLVKYGIRGLWLSFFLRHAEYKKKNFFPGINRERLKELDREWTKRLLRE